MKKLLKISVVLILVLLLVVGGLLAAVIIGLDSGVKAAVEKGGSFALRVPVQLDEVSVSILKGRATLKGLTVKNPEGYKTARAIGLGRAALEIKLSSVNQEVIEIPELTIEGPELTVEGSVKGSNIGQLLKNLDETIAQMGGGGEQEPAKPAEGPEQKFRIGRILITDARLSLSATFMGGREAGATVPRIEIVPGNEPMTMAELMKKIIGDVMREAARNPGEAGKMLGGLVVNSGLGMGGKADDIVKKSGEEATTVIKKGTEGLKNIFKKGE
jgi:uncharacterized protein involved in outer membrane biogenesis